MDVSHELGALRFVVDSPLSSKVAMFNQQVNQHKQSQLLNPFSQTDGRASPKPSFSKDEYGKPLAGSLTEMRGQKANMHVLKEMLELCQIIDSEGYNVKDEPTMRVIPFGELFNIYNYISDKVVGILLRARKHKLVEFEGEMLFQRRDDDVPIFLIKPIHEIRREMQEKIESIKRSGSPAPQATSVILDKRAHGLDVPKGATPRSSVSRTPSPEPLKSVTPATETKAKTATAETAATTSVGSAGAAVNSSAPVTKEAAAEAKEEPKSNAVVDPPSQQQEYATIKATATAAETKTDVNNNNNNNNNSQNDLPTIIIEASAVSEGPAKLEETSETVNVATSTAKPATIESNNVESNVPVEPSASA